MYLNITSLNSLRHRTTPTFASWATSNHSGIVSFSSMIFRSSCRCFRFHIGWRDWLFSIFAACRLFDFDSTRSFELFLSISAPNHSPTVHWWIRFRYRWRSRLFLLFGICFIRSRRWSTASSRWILWFGTPCITTRFHHFFNFTRYVQMRWMDDTVRWILCSLRSPFSFFVATSNIVIGSIPRGFASPLLVWMITPSPSCMRFISSVLIPRRGTVISRPYALNPRILSDSISTLWLNVDIGTFTLSHSLQWLQS